MRTWIGTLLAGGVMLAVMLAVAPPQAPAGESLDLGAVDAQLSRLERQAQLLAESAAEVEAKYWTEVEPLERALRARARDPELAKAAAWALVREAETRHVSPALLAAVLLVENPWLIPDTASYAGAVGWMQIMPFHARDGLHSHCGDDLTDGPTSVCYGADILAKYLGRALDDAIRRALLAYNGCRRTPGCEVYADHVLARTQ